MAARSRCLICDSESLNQIIDLGSHPFADTFIPESKKGDADIIYPLVCDLCENCGHIQTRYETDPKLRYSQTDYSYTSSNSSFSRNHWNEYSKEVQEIIKLNPNSFILEIGSNDGYLAEQFIKLGNKTVGIDPSPYMADLAKKRGVETFVELFSESSVNNILSKHGYADLVVANNVYNHANNPVEFTKAVANVLKEGGFFVFEQPYWLETLKSGKFDQIYHEHVSYFTLRSLLFLLKKAKMNIISAKIVDYHGGSLRVIAQKGDFKGVPEDIEKKIKEEIDYGTFKLETYRDFMEKNIKQRSIFLQKVHKLKEDGNAIIAVGAAAKGNTFLNFYRLDSTLIDYVTDSSPHKQNKYTPATRIPIRSDEIFSKYETPYALILSWNIENQLRNILSKINKNIKFISPDKN